MRLAGPVPNPPVFELFVVLHLLCVIGGFGFLAYNGITLTMLRRRVDGAPVGPLQANRDLSQLAELLILGAFVFGVGAVAASHNDKFTQVWVPVSMALWVVEIGILHAWIRPRQRRFLVVATDVAATPVPPGSVPPGADELDRIERSLSAGWAVFNLVMVAVVVLMVVRPGG